MRDLREDPDYEIRYFEPEDAPFIRAQMLDPELLPYSAPSNELEVEELVKLWVAFSRFKSGLIALYRGKPVAAGLLLLMPYLKVSHHCLLNLCVNPHEPTFGRSLIKNLAHLAKRQFRIETVMCELLGDHPFTPLLKEEGFVEVFRQEGFAESSRGLLRRVMWERGCS